MLTTFAKADLDRAAQICLFKRAVDTRHNRVPFEWYEPSRPGHPGRYSNQLGFHKATQKYRVLVPGNGWGKTTCMGAEAHAWATHANVWQETPKWPVLMVWFVKLSTQFDIIRVQLQADIFGDSARWVDDSYIWPDGSRLWIGKADQRTDWLKWQGIPVDLALFDEMPPVGLWREMVFRRRAKRKTRYVIAATATDPDNLWAETELYKPWLQFHADKGIDAAGALEAQAHPDIWFWDQGGIEDNPAADAEDVEHYESEASKLHPKLARVRRRGGFQHWIGDGVFDDLGIDWMQQQSEELDKTSPAKNGTLDEAEG